MKARANVLPLTASWIIVTHDRRTLDKIERILARLDKDTSKQVGNRDQIS